MVRVSLALAAAGALCACTNIGDPASRDSTVYLGFVRVARPPVAKNDSAGSQIVASDTRGIGLKVGPGLGVGYFHDEQYQAPTDCRIVFLVRTEEQLHEIIDRFAGLKEGVCAAVKS